MGTCLILGNGPSLANFPVALLERYDSYGSNYIHIQPKFYVCIDETVIKEHSGDILERAKNADVAYLPSRYKDWPSASELYALPNVQLVGRDTDAFKSENYETGFTCSYVALKLAYYAGYDAVWLFGVDHSPSWEHFKADYPQGVQGAKRLAHMQIMEWHYSYANYVYHAAGKAIVNFSSPSVLDEIFGQRGQVQ